MYSTYLRRELAGRKKQTIIVAAGLGVAIALVIVVNALSGGVRDAQARALESVYGVGTDLTVTGVQAEPGEPGEGGPRFDFDSGAGSTEDGTTTIDQSQLMTDMMRGTLDASALDEILEIDAVAGASGALSLTNTTFSGEMPDMSEMQELGDAPEGGAQGDGMPQGGPDGAGGSSFGIDSFTVLGIEPGDEVGPMSAVELTDGRLLTSDDAGADVAVVDETYATTSGYAVGDTIEVGGTDMEIVGIVASTSSEADTAANVYIPLDVAQTLSGAEEAVSTVYVQASSADAITRVQSAIEEALPDATVSSQSELASTVSDSLSSASSLITSLGTWLSILVLAVAVVLAVLFTISGVSRRTREFGTLKAIGWSNGRVIGQVAGESVVQGLIGGIVGLVIGLAAIVAITIIQPTISTASSTSDAGGPGGPGGMDGAMGGGMGPTVSAAADITLTAPISVGVIALALALAVGAGLVSGAFGGWRASRLSPAEALRSVG